MKRLLISILLLLASFFLGRYFLNVYNSGRVFVSPITQIDPTVVQKTDVPKKRIYGFLPFWQLNTVVLQPELTHLAYFSLTFDGSGEILTVNDGKTDPGYRVFQSDAFTNRITQARSQGTHIDLVITQLNNDDIEEFLNSPQSQQRLFEQIDAILLSTQFSGINLDVEYQGAATKQLREQFTQFSQNLHSFLKDKHPATELSIDVYSSSILGNSIWDITMIHPYYDYFIIMGYDFHKAGSPLTGPVAPLISEGEFEHEKNITQYLAEFLRVVPSSKIILGLPFYGYEWQTVSADPRSQTYPRSGATASFQRIQQIIANPELTVTQIWEDSTLSPYLTYIQDEKQKIIFYENEQSLGYKLDLVNLSELGGIAIWALGYEGEYRNLWDVINLKF